MPPEIHELIQSLQAEIADLRGRIESLEGNVFKTRGLNQALHKLISNWPGPFTAQLIRQAIYELHPDLERMTKAHTIEAKFSRMEKQGTIRCVSRGSGPAPSIYEFVTNPPADAGKRGVKVNSRHSHQSGFRSLVRMALNDLPKHFTLAHVKKWIADNHEQIRIPEGSWSATLQGLVDTGELEVVRFANRGKALKEYTRTDKRVVPSGDDIRALEQSWNDFRASMGLKQIPDIAIDRLRYETPKNARHHGSLGFTHPESCMCHHCLPGYTK